MVEDFDGGNFRCPPWQQRLRAADLLELIRGTWLPPSVMAAAALMRHHPTSARRRFVAAATLVLLYTAALVTAGVASRPGVLSAGDWKCFDDWCITVRSTTATATGRRVTLEARNAGRGRAQRPDSPHVVLEPAGRPPVPVPVTGLDQQLNPGQTAALTCEVTWTGPGRLIVTEGGWPSRLVVGDENSPWHAHAGWNL